MKGFTKGKGKGKKFIPTTKKKSSLSKSDIGKREITIKKYIPIDERKKQSMDMIKPMYTEDDYRAFRDKVQDPAFYGEDMEDAGVTGMDLDTWADSNWDEMPENVKKKMRTHYRKHLSGTLNWQGQDDTFIKKGFSKNIIPEIGEGGLKGEVMWHEISPEDIVNRKTGMTEAESNLPDTDKWQGQRAKQTLGSFGDKVIEMDDEGRLSDHPKNHPEQVSRFKERLGTHDGVAVEPALVYASVDGTRLGHTSPSYLSDEEIEDEMDKYVEFRSKIMKNKRSDENDAVFRRTQKILMSLANEATERDLQKRGVGGRSKFSLLGTKSPQEQKLEAKEDKINQNNKLAKETEKVEKKEAKADEKTAKALRKTDEQKLKSNEKSIRFLEKQIKGLQEKPAKYGVNAQSQLDVIEQARNDLKNLQSETDEIRTRLNEVQ